MVDIISFAIPDNTPVRETRSNMPNFDVTSQPVQSPQPPQSNIQTLASLQPQQTGYMSQGFTGQPLPAQRTGFPAQSFISQQTGYQQPPQPPQAPQPTLSVPGQFSGLSPGAPGILQSRPTGQPGQWGFVNAPAGSMAGIEALQLQLMPQPNRQGGFSSAGLQGSANIPWAVTKDEKTCVLGGGRG
jgi:actin cytoskeleton-regulatory complex protein PAN1